MRDYFSKSVLILKNTKQGQREPNEAKMAWPHFNSLCSAGCGWWLVLVCCERKLLLAGG